MKCVVTGGTGFIGSSVVDALRRVGNDVLVVDVRSNGAGEVAEVDVTDSASLTRTFQDFGAAYIFHCAAVADAREALRDPVKAVQVNIGGTASVLQAARQAGAKRVIVSSTVWVCGAMGPGAVDETEPFLSSGAGHVYTTTKIASELLAHDFHRLYGLPFTILRYGIPYGPRMWPGLVLRSFLDQAFSGQPLIVHGDGSQSRRFLCIEDLAQAHVLALQDVAENQTYNLEGMRAVAIRELAELVSRLVGKTAVEYRPEPSRVGEYFKQLRQIVSNAKAYVELGWQPSVDLEEGVRQTIEWYKHTLAPTKAKSASKPSAKR